MMHILPAAPFSTTDQMSPIRAAVPLFVQQSLFRLRYLRERIWRGFNADRLLKPTKAAETLAPKLLAHLNEPIDIDEYLRNLITLELWEERFDERERPSPMKWWSESLKRALSVQPQMIQRVLPEDPETFRKEFFGLDPSTWEQVELQAWDPEQL